MCVRAPRGCACHCPVVAVCARCVHCARAWGTLWVGGSHSSGITHASRCVVHGMWYTSGSRARAVVCVDMAVWVWGAGSRTYWCEVLHAWECRLLHAPQKRWSGRFPERINGKLYLATRCKHNYITVGRTLLWGAEVWRMTESTFANVVVFENKCFWQILGRTRMPAEGCLAFVVRVTRLAMSFRQG